MPRLWRVTLAVKDGSETDHLPGHLVKSIIQEALDSGRMGHIQAEVSDMEDYGITGDSEHEYIS